MNCTEVIFSVADNQNDPLWRFFDLPHILCSTRIYDKGSKDMVDCRNLILRTMHTSSRLGISTLSILLPLYHQGSVVHHSDETILVSQLTDKSHCLFLSQTGKPWTFLPGQRKKMDAAPLTAIGCFCLISSASWPSQAWKPCKLQPKSPSTLKPMASGQGHYSL